MPAARHARKDLLPLPSRDSPRNVGMAHWAARSDTPVRHPTSTRLALPPGPFRPLQARPAITGATGQRDVQTHPGTRRRPISHSRPARHSVGQSTRLRNAMSLPQRLAVQLHRPTCHIPLPRSYPRGRHGLPSPERDGT